MSLPDLIAILDPLVRDLLPAFLVAAGPVLVLGVPAIMAAATLPARLGVHPMKEEELTDAQRRWLDDIDGLLMPQGFAPALTFTAGDLDQANVNRAYVSSGEPAVALAGSMVQRGSDGGTLASSWFEFETRYADGYQVSTGNAAGNGRFAMPADLEKRSLPHLRNPLALKRAHDQACEPHRARGACFYRSEELADLMEIDHEQQMQYQVERGRYVRKEDGRYRLSFLQAVRHVVGYINPLEQRQHWRKAASALLLATLPLVSLAVGAIGAPFVDSQLALGDPRIAFLIATLVPILLGSAALGAVLEAKAPIWAFLVPLVEVRMQPFELSGLEHLLPLVIGGLCAHTALWTSNRINQRRGML